MHVSKLVYLFTEGSLEMKNQLGGKGANLSEMLKIGLSVPPGFTITTQACLQFYARDRQLWSTLKDEISQALKDVEATTGKVFGSKKNPLLLSVRSGAVVSMPGMMDTVLNLGLNDETVVGLYQTTGNKRFAYDCYRRFIQMFGEVVLKVEHYRFEQILVAMKHEVNVEQDIELQAEDLETMVSRYKELIWATTGRPFPEDPLEQLYMAITAVFASWHNRRAKVYRRINNIPEDLGTAVNVQAMVFGNSGTDSGTGVAFTRNPSTGERELFGEYLLNAQGEDVVAGVRTPKALTDLAEDMPAIFEELLQTCELLEKHNKDMQDIEFTIEKGKLYLLQTRSGKRTAKAAVAIAVGMAEEGLISQDEALLRVKPDSIEAVLHRSIDPDITTETLVKGLPASPGAATGSLVFDADKAVEAAKMGPVILVRPETTPDDIHGMVQAAGVLTSRGGMTSHAAVVARGMGKPCICGCERMHIDLINETLTVGDIMLKAGDIISIDGSTGRVFQGEVKAIEPEASETLEKLLKWADKRRRLGVRANADTPTDAAKAREFGAEGIGLCRTEHMFMAPERLPIVRQMILAETLTDRKIALEKLKVMQQEDFTAILQSMEGMPVTIRLLDPPLHEFLPSQNELLIEVTVMECQGASQSLLAPKRELLRKVRALHEQNPMLGHRGCRLAITYPEIYEMQTEAIARAAHGLKAEGVDCQVEIMLPLIGHVKELEIMNSQVSKVLKDMEEVYGNAVNVTIGTMIELPRACLVANEIAAHVKFFSFGTNDLTQTTFGFSRDDAESKFLPDYLQQNILKDNPFAVLDVVGVGELIQIACDRGLKVNADLKLGVCGEHGGDPASIQYFHDVGLHYVSCSPYRVPVARLSAAQAALKR